MFCPQIASFVPYQNREVLDRVRRLSGKELERHANPAFRIRIVSDATAIWVADMVARIQESDRLNRRCTMILPNPCPVVYESVAEVINLLRIQCRNLHVFTMDEWADGQGNVAPPDYRAGFTYSQLKYFYAVAENLHVTKTAEQLHIAQPALTQSVRRLEHELGHPLFAAKGRNIVLTEYGKYLKEQLAPILERLDTLPHELETLAALERETIHINVSAASTVVTECIIQYRRQNRNVNFKVVQSDSAGMPYDIDISTELRHKGENSSTCIFTERIFLAVPAVGKYAGRRVIRLSEVSDEEFISLADVKNLRTICDKFCREAGFSPRIVFESDNQNAVKNLIAAGVGVGFWPEYTWGAMDSPDVNLIGITDPECKRDIVLTCNENKEDTCEVRRFYDFITDYFEKLFQMSRAVR